MVQPLLHIIASKIKVLGIICECATNSTIRKILNLISVDC